MTRSNSSRKRSAVRGLCRAYHAAPPSASSTAAGWKRIRYCITYASGLRLVDAPRPTERIEQHRVQLFHSACDDHAPVVFGILIRLFIETVDERVGESRSCGRRQFQRPLENVGGIVGHVFSLPNRCKMNLRESGAQKLRRQHRRFEGIRPFAAANLKGRQPKRRQCDRAA